jgi:hypothetical protein
MNTPELHTVAWCNGQRHRTVMPRIVIRRRRLAARGIPAALVR